MTNDSNARIAVVGEALIDLIADADGRYRPHLGGSPYNVAIGLARQGLSVSYLSPFSEDAFGDQLRETLLNEGVEVHIDRRSALPTSLALVTVDDGIPSYRLYREGIADKDTSFAEVKENLPADLKVFHTGSLAITPSQLPTIQALITLMRERNVVVSLDINIRLPASTDTRTYLEGVRSLLPLADIVKASDEDLTPFRFAGDPVLAAERAYGEMGSGMLVLTRGTDGAHLFTPRGTITKSAYQIDSIGDTVGAGDTFQSAFLAALCRAGAIAGSCRDADADTLSKALDFACAAAAINVSRSGCSPPTQAEVDTFIASAPDPDQPKLSAANGD